MINQQLLDFIKAQLSKGLNKETIVGELLTNGWTAQDIEEGFKNLVPASNVPIPNYYSPVTNKSHWKLILSIVVILIILAGGVYYFLQNKNLILSQSIKNNVPIENVTIKTYANENAGYLISYPSNWQLPKLDNSNPNQDVVTLNNKDNNQEPPSQNFIGVNLKNDGSRIGVVVSPEEKYLTLDEKYLTFGGKTNTEKVQQYRQGLLSKIATMNIGGKELRVFKDTNYPNNTNLDTYVTYGFIYNKNSYILNFTTGSDEQYSKDYPVFANLVSSFAFYK